MWDIESHTRRAAITKPRKLSRTKVYHDDDTPECQHCNQPVGHAKPYRGTSVQNCQQATGAPCKCIRLSGACVQCRRDITVTHGERAEGLPHEKGRLIGYRCVRCR